jgi:tetratricopeptide (TPR) repeat protein
VPESPARPPHASPWEPWENGPWARLLPWLVLTLVASVHARSLAGELVYDDLLLVARNPRLTSFAHLPQVLTSGYWDFLEPREAEQIGYWRPLTAMALMVGHYLGRGEPWAFHALCVAIHTGATGAAFLLARRLSRSVWVASFAALLFGLHPLQVESVAWISALNDPLFGCLALFSLWAFVRWREGGSRGHAWLAATLFAAALLAKELSVAILPLAAVLDLARRRTDEARPSLGSFAPGARAYGPFVAVLGAYYLARCFVFASPLAGFERITTDFGVGWPRLLALRAEILGGAIDLLAWPFGRWIPGASLAADSTWHGPVSLAWAAATLALGLGLLRRRAWLALASTIALAGGLIALPLELQLFRPFVPQLEIEDRALASPLLCMAGALGLAVELARRRAWLALGALLWIPVCLAPVLWRVESLGAFPLSDRFLYLPVLGASLLLVLAARLALRRSYATWLLLVLAGAFAARTVHRIGTWRDEETLFRTAAAETPRSPYVLWGLGRVLLTRFQATRDPAHLQRAFEVYESAGKLLEEAKSPTSDVCASSRDYLQVNLGLGWCYVFAAESARERGMGTAIAIFEELRARILQLQRDALSARALGLRVRSEQLELEQVLTALGVAHMLAGDLAAAEAVLREAAELNPRYPEALQNLGRLASRRGDTRAAVRWFEAALAERPGHYEAELLLCQTLVESSQDAARKGLVDETRADAARARTLAFDLLERDLARPQPLVALAALDLSERNATGALAWLDRAVRVDPDHGQAWYLHGKAALALDDRRTAREDFARASELMPNAFEAAHDLAALLVDEQQFGAAEPYLVRAYARCADPQVRERVRQALERWPTPSLGLFMVLAEIDEGRGEVDLALVWLDAALALDARHGPALHAKALILRGRRERESAAELLRVAVEVLADSFVVWNDYGTLSAELGRGEEARRALERALAIGPPAEWPPDLRSTSLGELRARLQRLDQGR